MWNGKTPVEMYDSGSVTSVALVHKREPTNTIHGASFGRPIAWETQCLIRFITGKTEP